MTNPTFPPPAATGLILAALICAAAALTGCSRAPQPPAPAEPAPTPPASTAPPATLPAVRPVAPLDYDDDMEIYPARDPLRPGSPEAIEQARLTEEQYRATTTVKQRVQALYQLSSQDTPEALQALGRLFQAEPDPELREEILESLLEFTGQKENKLAILTAALGPDQPLGVRETAIDVLIDLAYHEAIPVLQGLLQDPNQTVRDMARDAIIEIQELLPSRGEMSY
jgi:hypothetical protein